MRLIPLIEQAIRQQLEDFVHALKAREQHDQEEGFYYWQDGERKIECGVCTNGANLVVKEFGGRVVGYARGANPTALAGKPADMWGSQTPNDGHDFALVAGRYIVDYWLHAFCEDYPKGVFDMQDDQDEVRRLYGDPELWVTVHELS